MSKLNMAEISELVRRIDERDAAKAQMKLELEACKASLDIAVTALKKIRTQSNRPMCFDGETLLSDCHVLADDALKVLASQEAEDTGTAQSRGHNIQSLTQKELPRGKKGPHELPKSDA